MRSDKREVKCCVLFELGSVRSEGTHSAKCYPKEFRCVTCITSTLAPLDPSSRSYRVAPPNTPPLHLFVANSRFIQGITILRDSDDDNMPHKSVKAAEKAAIEGEVDEWDTQQCQALRDELLPV